MNIEFAGVYAPNEDFGIGFQAKVNGENVSCVISSEALDDIDPDNRFDEATQKFLNNQSQFESIAQEKILKGEVVGGKVYINQSDVL